MQREPKTADRPVAIVGAGPTGLMLAAELALAGVNAVILESRSSQALAGVRAGGLHARTLEVLDQRGVVDRFLAAGQAMQIQGFAGIRLDISDFPSRHPYGLALWQNHIERLLAEWATELNVTIRYGCPVVGFTQDATGVDVALADGSTLRAGYLVGCDGGRSGVRKAAGIDFPGQAATRSWIIGEVALTAAPPIGMRPEGGGIGPLGDATAATYRIVLTEDGCPPGDPDLADLRAALIAAYGTDFGAHAPTWISRFTDMTRQAAAYRVGRVLVAGDAAHVHPPQGGQGLNTGVQDAVNLGWKLAQVVRGTSPPALLDTYHAERHPIAARVLHNTRAQVALSGADPQHLALRGILTDMLALDGPRRQLAGMLTGLDLHYDLGVGHALLGRRMPDLDLETPAGPTRVFTLLHDARPVLLAFGPHDFDATPWGRVRSIVARPTTGWTLPVVGAVDPVRAVLIRPDGHVAWTGALSDPALPDALDWWCGRRTAG